MANITPKLQEDLPHRTFRYVEVLSPQDMKRSRNSWSLVEGWLQLAESLEPCTTKALLEGDSIVRLTDGTLFKEVSYKAEHSAVERALEPWSSQSGRRWAWYHAGLFHISDGQVLDVNTISVSAVE